MNLKLLTLTLLLAGTTLLPAPAAAHGRDRDDAVRRETRFGPVVGVDSSRKDGTYAWKGVPFAAPPVGELRWRAPVDPKP